MGADHRATVSPRAIAGFAPSPSFAWRIQVRLLAAEIASAPQSVSRSFGVRLTLDSLVELDRVLADLPVGGVGQLPHLLERASQQSRDLHLRDADARGDL